MAAIPQPTAAVTGSGDVTAQFAGQLPGFDASAVIAAQEHGLAEYLNLPVQEILARLGFPPLPTAPPPGPLPPEGGPPPNAPASPMDPGQLIKPVTDALGTLGDGVFEGLDPTQMFDGVAQAFDSSNSSLASALGDLTGNWEGAGGTAAAAKTATALDNGAALKAQANALRNSLAAAAATVKQAEARLIEIIGEFMATMAAIGPNIIFPWGWAAAIAAATEAVTRATETMTELQAELAAQTAAVTAAGEPVPVTEAPLTTTAVPSQLTSATSSASGGSQGLSSLMSAATKAAQAGTQTATDLASQLSGMASQGTAGTAGSTAAAAGTAARAGHAAGGGGSAGGGAGGGSAGGSGASTLAARSAPPMPPVSEDLGRAVASSARAGAALGAGYGAPMMGAPMAPMAHGGRMAGGDHTAPAFLQTTDHGDEIVGDLGTAAPPVIGEA
ncbi:hypothetical protein [Mycolicibacterium wolinskyi]|uniref:hypothetical protein n=1 Tax=Mycolicibacterium wolinskyi TaxID=59750 RepID=UPI003917792F